MNYACLLPDYCILVGVWSPHPCDWSEGKPGGYYLADAWCYGPAGRVGMWIREWRP